MTREEKNEKCYHCHGRKFYERKLDMHFDWVDCPFVCDVNKEEVEILEKKEDE